LSLVGPGLSFQPDDVTNDDLEPEGLEPGTEVKVICREEAGPIVPASLSAIMLTAGPAFDTDQL
jgi:hypothetical protein